MNIEWWSESRVWELDWKKRTVREAKIGKERREERSQV